MNVLQQHVLFTKTIFYRRIYPRAIKRSTTGLFALSNQRRRHADRDFFRHKIVFLQAVEKGTPGLQGDKARGIIFEDLGMKAPAMVEKEFKS
ncbi:hypothetical protein [Brevibacillus parabrevis]|uniref:hypothetical protein n=1 Tax=Brevibacillus parabrevis TaxID=54914 RepID=UPI0028D4EF1F|nr:hypothetical protein [Brevibacillus parabrevis]